jgi:transcriptional regulator with XRE-family HTH domain
MIDRLKKIIEMSHLSERAFASRCGLTQNALWYQLNGKRKLSLETVLAVIDAFPEVSPTWLMVGRGNMLERQNESEYEDRINSLMDTIAIQQEVINNLKNKIKELQK